MVDEVDGPKAYGHDDPWQEPPGFGRAILLASAIGVVGSFIGVTLVTLALGAEAPSAIGLGLFVAFWGGLGFGVMVGGVVWASRLEAQTEDAPRLEVGTVPTAAPASADPPAPGALAV